MKVHFQIEYTNANGDSVESMSALDFSVAEDRETARKLLQEYLDNHDTENAKLHFGGECLCPTPKPETPMIMKPDSRPSFVNYAGYDLTQALASVGEGWAPLIHEVFTFIEHNNITNPKIVQVKEKWGGLRVYTDIIHDELDRKIRDVEKRSYTICDVCGNTGAMCKKGSWYMTRCPDHTDGAVTLPPIVGEE